MILCLIHRREKHMMICASYPILRLPGLQHALPPPHLGTGEEGIGKRISAGVDGEL